MTRDEYLKLSNQEKRILKLKRQKRRRTKRLVRLTTFALLLFLCFISMKVLAALITNGDKNVGANPPPPQFEAASVDLNRDSGETLQLADEDNPWIPILKKLADKNAEVNEIIQHINKYPDRILELLNNNLETIDFVLNYPALANVPVGSDSIDLTDSYTEGSIPLFLQWDTRWGYSRFGENGLIALDGCGPTCLSMVMVALTGDLSWNPLKMAEYCEQEGYLAGSSTSWELMTSGAQNLGLNAKELPLDESRVLDELIKGNPIICSMRPGDFTTTGHFIVLSGYQDGKLLVNDPNSRERSQKQWEFSKIKYQIKNLWVFS